MLTAGFRSLQRGTVGLYRSKGCKVVVGQALMINHIARELNPGRPHMVRLWPSGRIYFQISNFEGLQLCSLPLVPLLKDLNLANNIVSDQVCGSISKIEGTSFS